MDGPIFKNYEQRPISDWKKINFLWEKDAKAYFYGCRTGLKPTKNDESFAQRFANTQNITTFGQIEGTVFSKSNADYKRVDENYEGPVYLICVGGWFKRGIGRIFKVSPYPLKKFKPNIN
jgi:hypothetical protein